jgi:hypothetical protein
LFAEGVPRLASIPLDPQISRAGDRGRPVLVADGTEPQAAVFRDLGAQVLERLSETGSAWPS